ncbi:MAG TPA: ABC transporter ATP-binding protein [Paenirhodobacter sp.]
MSQPPPIADQGPLLSAHDVSRSYRIRGGGLRFRPATHVHALDRVTLEIGRGEVLGLVGESGSGKSTFGKLVAGLEQPTSGQITFRPRTNGGAGVFSTVGPQMIFQNAVAALDPKQTIGAQLIEAARVHGFLDDVPKVFLDRIMAEVGLPRDLADRLPRQLSGGQCQRVVIARALATRPELLICDEPTSALDVSIQAQVLNLLADIRARTGCSYLFISHDLPVVERLSDRVAILYLGRIVEIAPTRALFAAPAHPYTRALIAAVPRIDQRKHRFEAVKGEIPSPVNPPKGCHFHPRCPLAIEICRSQAPPMLRQGDGHFAACHLLNETLS